MTNELHDSTLLQFSRAILDENYRLEWNIRMNDFIYLMKNGKPLRNTLYRIGGINSPKLNVDKYFMLIKHYEGFYSNEILEMSKSKNPKHLEGVWCILDKNGDERITFKPFESPYLVDNSCVYSINNNYYNIETGELYCHTNTVMRSTDYLFLENRFDKDVSKRGVLKINKSTGIVELFN